MASQHNGLPSKPEHAASRPRYSIQSFDTGYSSSSYSSYSDSLTDPIAEYGYASNKLTSTPGKTTTQPESFGFRVFSTLSDAVKKSPNNIPNLSRTASVHTRARSIADSPGAMLARTTSIRLSGLLNRTPTQKTAKPTEDQDDDLSEPEDMPEYKPTFSGTPSRTTTHSQNSTPRHTPSRPSTAHAHSQKGSRFSWFTAPKPSSPTVPHTSDPLTASLELSDPLLTLNIPATLFPHGPTDPHDPASYNDLLLSATALCNRLQSAYCAQASLLKQAQAERDAATEEKDEAATRAAHLKSQLETLAARAGEQETAMRELSAQLSAERQRRAEEERELGALRRRTELEGRQDSFIEKGERREEDNHDRGEEATPRRGRKARTSEGLNSDSGFESDAESISYSVDTASTVSGPVTPATVAGQFGGGNGTGWEKEGERTVIAGKGNTAGVWGVVGDLQRDNYRLRTRVKELEGAVEGCLEMVA
ncbi:hypothetical protein C1H76_7775 [Elsinoe australis]|uniref:Uncharacterized protein n=1 Tax=Elsinoe australis TaxID=40998 RepID=A0A4U7APL4_9PEZI|nr:hypothetical protein C1H76_7775 [Elsinoe australis]